MCAAQSIRTRGNIAHSRANHHQLLFGNRNILTLTGKELELVEETERYIISIFLEFLQLRTWLLVADGSYSDHSVSA